MIEQVASFPENIVGFVCHGHVTSGDYESVVVPAADRALAKPGSLRLYYEVATDFDGISPGAVWEDFKVGVEHLRRWDRAAVVTDVDWIRNAIRLFGFMLPGGLKIFPTSKATEARAWITAP